MKLEDIKSGMYIRTLFGNIYKIQDEEFEIKQSAFTGDVLYKKNNEFETITKASHNIIDLIEVGDYVNGVRVERIDKDPFIKGQINLWTNEIMSNYWGDISLTPIRDKDIKSIVTKEQFESMSYKVGE